jgi:flavin-binding protein dodecin
MDELNLPGILEPLAIPNQHARYAYMVCVTASGRTSQEEAMSDPIYKVVEVVGTSGQSISKAIDSAINKASGTLRHLGWFEVGQIRGDIKDGRVNRYQVTLRIGFTLE